jgi:hypothetical protein
MANFKFYSAAVAALAFAGIANAQNVCTAAIGGTGATIVRAEGQTELIGEITVSCYGGNAVATAFQVQLPAAAIITSKPLGASTFTDAVAFYTTGSKAGTFTQGSVGTTSPNVVSFGITLDGGGNVNAPTTVFTIANVRLNASALGLTSFSSISANVVGINTSVISAGSVTVANVLGGLTKPTINNANTASGGGTIANPAICNSRNAYANSAAPYANNAIYWVHFGEGFPNAFKTLGAPVTVLGTESPNTESGYAPLGTAGYGVATSATRFTVTLTGLPAVTVWLPITVWDDSTASKGFGGSIAPTGILTMVSNPAISNTLQSPFAASTSSSAPDRGAAANGPNGTSPGYVAYTPVNGTVTAYYEVTQSSAIVAESFSIPVAINFSGNTISPVTTATTANVSFAPVSNTTYPSFAATSNTPLSGSKFVGCTSTLLFPYLVNAAGFDTGITISNTSVDPFGTGNQNGSCTLYYYNGAAGSAGNTTSPSFTVNAGVTYANLMSVLNPGFTGYAIAQCTFQYAHGFAFITDGFASPGRGLSQGYLALAIPDPAQTARSNFSNPATFGESLGN